MLTNSPESTPVFTRLPSIARHLSTSLSGSAVPLSLHELLPLLCDLAFQPDHPPCFPLPGYQNLPSVILSTLPIHYCKVPLSQRLAGKPGLAPYYRFQLRDPLARGQGWFLLEPYHLSLSPVLTIWHSCLSGFPTFTIPSSQKVTAAYFPAAFLLLLFYFINPAQLVPPQLGSPTQLGDYLAS